jgi:hypothetical protein
MGRRAGWRVGLVDGENPIMERVLRVVCQVLGDQGLIISSDSGAGPIRVPLARCTAEIAICDDGHALSLRVVGQRPINIDDDELYLWRTVTETACLHQCAYTSGKLLDHRFEDGVVSVEARLPLDEGGTFDRERFRDLFDSLVHPVDSLIYDLDLIFGKPSPSATHEPPSRLATATQLHRNAQHYILERMWNLGPRAA